MASKPLTTRITEDTHRRVKIQAVLTGRSMEEIVEMALRNWVIEMERASQQTNLLEDEA